MTVLENTDIHWALTLHNGTISIGTDRNNTVEPLIGGSDLHLWVESCSGLYRDEGPVFYISIKGFDFRELQKRIEEDSAIARDRYFLQHSNENNTCRIFLRNDGYKSTPIDGSRRACIIQPHGRPTFIHMRRPGEIVQLDWSFMDKSGYARLETHPPYFVHPDLYDWFGLTS